MLRAERKFTTKRTKKTKKTVRRNREINICAQLAYTRVQLHDLINTPCVTYADRSTGFFIYSLLPAKRYRFVLG